MPGINKSKPRLPQNGAGSAKQMYTLILGALLIFLFAGSLLIWLGSAIEAKEAKNAPQAEAISDAKSSAESPDGGAESGTVSAKAHNNRYFVLPLSDEMQDAVYRLSDKYDVPPELVFGIISADSMTRSPSGGKTDVVMDLPEDSADWCASQLGIAGTPTYEENIECGILLLQEFCHKYDDINTVAMCYELGEDEAVRLIDSGQTSTAYSRLVSRETSTLTERPAKG